MSLISSLVNAFTQSSATKSAQKAITSSNDAANAEARRQFDLQRSDLAPYREAGQKALPYVSGAYGIGTPQENQASKDAFFNASPDYNFGFEQGNRAVQGTLGAGGMGRFGGGALKALNRYGQDYATTRFGNWRTGLQSMTGMGQSAVNSGNQASQNFSDAYGANTRSSGDARASSYIRQGQIWGPQMSDFENKAGKYAAYAYGGGFG